MEPPYITLYSNPMVSTWVFDETHRVLFDAGDGVAAMLDSRIQKVKLAAITHSHRDHCAGLMQFLNLRGPENGFKAVIPENSGSGRALAQFLTSFDTRSTGRIQWHYISSHVDLPIQPDKHVLREFETIHYTYGEETGGRSLGYHIVRMVDKIKPEYRQLDQAKLDDLRRSLGKEALTETVEDVLFSVTGDTMRLDPAIFEGSRALLHECTFLDNEEHLGASDRGRPHAWLDEVLCIARDAKVERLGLYHISRRYDDEQIIKRVRERCSALKLEIPVSVALPGRLIENLFAETVWPGISS
ncbi:MAG: MBL fold metallo-hydrolase [Chthonomonadales bacterium]